MSTRLRMSWLALALLCLGGLSKLHLDAKAAAHELNPALFAEWAARREAVAAAREASNLDVLLELLTQEVTDPLPAELPHWPSDYTASELIQLSVLNALSKTPERGALVEAYVQVREKPPMEKRVVIALGLAGLVSLGEKEKEADDQTVLKRCLALLREDKNDFIRARAARSLWHIVQANTDLNLIPQVEPGLRAALKDEAGRPNTACNTAYGKTVYIVRAEARSALLVLGFELAPGEGIPYSD